MARFRDVLKNRNFLFLWLGQVISNFGDRLNQMALVALIYQRTPGSAMALAKLISFTIIPVFLIGPIAGVWVDRLDKRKVMVISDILRGILVFLIPLFIMANQILPIYLIVFLVFSISRFFIPSKMAIIPDLVSKDKLLLANTLSDTTHMIGNVVGLVVAGVIVNIRYIGAIGGFYIDAASFFASAILLGLIIQGARDRGAREDIIETTKAFENSLRRSILEEVREGIRHLVTYSDMRFIVAAFFLLMAGIGTVSCVVIVFIQDAFGTATRDLGFLGMWLVAGLFLGTLAYGRFGQRMSKRTVVYASFIASGLSIVLFTLAVRHYPNIAVAWTLVALLGISLSPIMISMNTLTHEVIAEEMRGRVFSSLEAVIHLAFLAFMFLAAYLSKYIGRMWILIAAGVCFFVCGLVGIVREGKKKAT
ncbi:MAG: MFS transporter [Candidatus Omnitrophica bacterium]|nr:MFS transporter [Candidatus Omnitrophota bacterium]